MYCCNSNQYTKYNNEKIKFFSLPVYKELHQKYGEQAKKQWDTNAIKNKQRTAGLHALKITEEEIQSKIKQHYNIRMYLKHFHPSI